jgi:protein-tyrosine phosphatase
MSEEKKTRPSKKQRALFLVSYGWNFIRTRTTSLKPFDVALSTKKGHRLWIGMIPNQTILKRLSDYKISSVFSVLESWEYKQLKSIVQPDELKNHGLRHYQLCMRDFSADVDVKEAASFALILCSELDKGNVYIHCKAGSSRSVMMSAIVLVFRGDCDSIDGAIHYLELRRPQAHVEIDKRQIAVKVLDMMRQK